MPPRRPNRRTRDEKRCGIQRAPKTLRLSIWRDQISLIANSVIDCIKADLISDHCGCGDRYLSVREKIHDALALILDRSSHKYEQMINRTKSRIKSSVSFKEGAPHNFSPSKFINRFFFIAFC